MRIIAKISVDAGVSDDVPTVLYSGNINGYSTGNIAKSLDNVRIIDNTKLGEFLLDANGTGEYKELLKKALENDISNGTFDISLVENGLRNDDPEKLKNASGKRNFKF